MKGYTVLLRDRAESDIVDVLLYSRRSAGAQLAEWHARLKRHLAGLAVRPRRCPTAPESRRLKQEIRFSVFGKRRGAFKIYFRIEDDRVIVLRVMRGSRRGLSSEDVS